MLNKKQQKFVFLFVTSVPLHNHLFVLFSQTAPPFISQSKNPCWWNGTGGTTQLRLHCLPYFFLAGVSKCGSTDIFSRLTGHPQVIPPKQKEPRWFDRRRFAAGISTRGMVLGWEGDAMCGVVVVFNFIMAGLLQCCFCAVVVRRMSFVWLFFIQELRKS